MGTATLMERIGALAAGVATCALLAGCALAPPRGSGEGGGEGRVIAGSAWAGASQDSPAGTSRHGGWEHRTLPGKAPVRFAPVRNEGRAALSATAVSAASVVHRRVRIEPHDLGRLSFSWKVPHLIEAADIGVRETEDAPVRVMLAFDGDRSRLSRKDAAVSELVRALTGEEMPYATLMYVWCNKRPPGAVVHNPRTGRIRSLVLESGPGRLDRWLDYERDVRADYERVFGEPPGALIGVAVMTDSDNTQSTAHALYGPLRHVTGRALHPGASRTRAPDGRGKPF